MEEMIPDEPGDLADINKRHAFLKQKHMFGDDDDDDEDAGAAEEEGGAKKGHIDLTSLEKHLKHSKLTGKGGADGEQLRELELQLESNERELKIAKEKLREAMRSEIYNEKTSIGETIHGLPLGCLNLKIITLEGYPPTNPGKISIVVSLKSTKPREKAVPGPPAQVSKPGRPSSLMKDSIDFNQQFVLAPIRSHDAQVLNTWPQPRDVGRLTSHLLTWFALYLHRLSSISWTREWIQSGVGPAVSACEI